MLLALVAASCLSLRPSPPLVHYHTPPARHAANSRGTQLVAAADEGCDPNLPPRPTLTGEKIAVTTIAVGIGAAVISSGAGASRPIEAYRL